MGDDRHPHAPERCPSCGWSNTGLLNYGTAGSARWLCHGCAARLVAAADEFVRAHCALEALANKVGADAACSSPLNDRVIDLHMKLEAAVLGDERPPGRRFVTP